MKYTYTAVLNFSEGGDIYAKVPDLPGCIATGTSIYEAVNMITDAALTWLAIAEDEGADIPKATNKSEIPASPCTVRIVLNLDTDSYRNVEE